MLRLTYPDGTVAEALDAHSARLLVEAANANRAYTVKTLALRLDISESGAYALIRDGDIRFVCAGKKNYRVSEQAVREYLGDAA